VKDRRGRAKMKPLREPLSSLVWSVIFENHSQLSGNR
jgi:hypothetical protein